MESIEQDSTEQIPSWANFLINQLQEQERTINQLMTRTQPGATTRSSASTNSGETPSSGETTTVQNPNVDQSLRTKKHLPDPPEFSGNKSDFPAWRLQIQAKLAIDKENDTEFVRFWYLHSRLRGRALAQVTPWVQSIRDPADMKVDSLIARLCLAYEDPELAGRATQRLNTMKQGRKDTFADFLARFDRTLLEAGGLAWADEVKKTFLSNGISLELQRALVAVSLPTSYEAYCSVLHSTSVRLELLHGREFKTNNYRTTPVTNYDQQRSNQMDWEPSSAVQVASIQTRRAAWVPANEIVRRREAGLCFRCGTAGHRVRECKLLPAAPPLTKVHRAVMAVPEESYQGEESEKE